MTEIFKPESRITAEAVAGEKPADTYLKVRANEHGTPSYHERSFDYSNDFGFSSVREGEHARFAFAIPFDIEAVIKEFEAPKGVSFQITPETLRLDNTDSISRSSEEIDEGLRVALADNEQAMWSLNEGRGRYPSRYYAAKTRISVASETPMEPDAAFSLLRKLGTFIKERDLAMQSLSPHVPGMRPQVGKPGTYDAA